MKKFKSLVLSLVTVILLSVFIPLFTSGLANNVNAAGDVIEVGSYDSFVTALESGLNEGKTFKLTSSFIADDTISVNFPCTLDLNGYSLDFAYGDYLKIEPDNSSDIVTITGNGYIGGSFPGGGVVYLDCGKLIIESGTIENKYDSTGKAINTYSSIITIYEGKFIGFNTVWIDNVDKNQSNYYTCYKDDKTGKTTTVFSRLKVADNAVYQDNAKDILGDGVFSYDYKTKTLSINGDCDFDPNEKVIQSKIPELIIDVQGPSSITGIFDLYYSTIITGNNKLKISCGSSEFGCIAADDILIKDVSIDINCTDNGIQCYEGSLAIDNASITVDTKSAAIVFGSNTISLKDCKIIEPENAVIGYNKIFKENGTDPANKVVIQPNNMWSDIEYTWSSDYSKCTAKRVCVVDETVVETETVTTTSKVKTPATTSEKGTTTYTATFLNKNFSTQTKDVQNIPVIVPDPVYDPSFEDFVERLYVVALNRPSEPEGKAFWCEHVGNGDLNGAQCANEFLLSKEFNDRNLSDEDFLKVLYKTFFDRDAEADKDGFNFWMNSLKTEGRDKVVDGFINSTEWCNICATYGVKSGATRAKATIASKNAIAFAERLYTKCLGRDAETDGLNFWSLGLTNLELTGAQAAHEFFFSKEFNDHNFDNKELLTRMYRTFMGREPDEDGMNFWLNNMKNGMTKEDVFNEFVKSAEFTQICKDYAIDRG
ncbi:MAG: DUF4214 domain-containing protein [Clostridia bacterium]|nr:DUF4214 domain-containing protein [Clostridia bacterium]